MTAWAFAMVGLGTNPIFSEVSRVTREICDTLPPRSLSGISWACALAKHHDRVLFADIVRRAVVTVEEFGGHDAAAFCWALATLGEPAPELFHRLATHLVAADHVQKLSTPLATELAWSFAAVQVRHEQFFRALEDLCAANLDNLETEDVAGFTWAFSVAGTGRPEAFAPIVVYVQRFAGRFRASELRIVSSALATVGAGGEELQAQLRDATVVPNSGNP